MFLFDPANVRGVLARVPSVAALIPDPADEGAASDAYPALRKTPRELYRWIANTHYEHLAAVVPTLERVHAAGCTFGHLLTTSSRERFVDLTAEVFVAEDLLDRGYSVRTIQLTNDPTPDLHVTGKSVDLAVEVYSPRELYAFDIWQDTTTELFSYMDVAADYHSSIATEVERTIPPEREQLDPWRIAGFLGQTREHVHVEIARDVEDALRELRPLTQSYAHPGAPLVTTVELTDVRASSPVGPVRTGALSPPGYGGYSPAGVFKKVVRKALRKARRRQVQGVTASARALVVYMIGTKIAEDLKHPAHMKGAEAVLEGIEPQEYGLDVLAFVVRALPQGLGYLLLIGDDATLTIPQIDALFHARPSG